MNGKVFIEVTPDIFHQLIGYTVGEVSEGKNDVFIRFDKQVDNVYISREILMDDDGMHVSEDYVLDIIPNENDSNLAEKSA